MNNKKRLLFTGGGGAGNELIYKLLNNKYDIFFADANKENISPEIPNDRKLRIPLAIDAKFASKISDLCFENKIDLLVPSVDEELPFIKEICGYNSNLNVMAPQHEHLTLMMDKLELMNYLLENGIDAPITKTLENIDGLSFPFFVKPRWGRGSRGIATIFNEEELQSYLYNSDYEKNEIIAQQLMSGIEYTVMISANLHGDLIAIVPVKVDLKKGITIKAITDKNDAVINACTKIHSLFKTKGCYNIQVFLQPDGSVLPIEINPRISTTFCLGLSAGVEAIENFYKKDINNQTLDDWKVGMRLDRHWTNYIS